MPDDTPGFAAAADFFADCRRPAQLYAASLSGAAITVRHVSDAGASIDAIQRAASRQQSRCAALSCVFSPCRRASRNMRHAAAHAPAVATRYLRHVGMSCAAAAAEAFTLLPPRQMRCVRCRSGTPAICAMLPMMALCLQQPQLFDSQQQRRGMMQDDSMPPRFGSCHAAAYSISICRYFFAEPIGFFVAARCCRRCCMPRRGTASRQAKMKEDDAAAPAAARCLMMQIRADYALCADAFRQPFAAKRTPYARPMRCACWRHATRMATAR